MTKLILEGGTDVAEVALFSIDALSSELPDNEGIEALEKEKGLIKFSTGADGAYLLHLYVGRDIESEIFKHCIKEDSLKGEFKTSSGEVAFGGVESAYREFAPNKNIRSDGKIEQGNYDYLAYHTEYPDDLIEEAVKSKIGDSGLSHLSRSALIGWAGVLLGLALLVLGFIKSYVFFVPLAVVAIATYLCIKKYTGTVKYKQLHDAKAKIELNYPSIVVQLTKKNA